MLELTKITLQLLSVIDSEKEINDSIFGGHDNNIGNPSHNTLHKSTDDHHYKTPDYKKFIFSNMGMEVATMNRMGIVSPIRVKKCFNQMTNLEYRNRFGFDKEGVVIVEYFTIHNSAREYISKIVDYYNTQSYMASDVELHNYIKDKVNTTFGGKFRHGPITIRIITLIPLETLKEQHVVYHKPSDTMVVYGDITEDIIHPGSNRWDDLMAMDKYKDEVNRNIIGIDIVSDNTSIPHYIKVGNEIMKVYPTREVSKEQGVTITHKRNGVIVHETKCGINDCETVGIYKDYNKCEHEGDLKLKLEIEKLAHETDKLTFSKTKLENDYEVLKLEMDGVINKYNHELELHGMKIELSKLDIDKKLLDQKIAIANTIMDLKYKTHVNMVDLYSRGVKHIYEIQKIREEAKKDSLNDGIKLATNLLNLGKSILK